MVTWRVGGGDYAGGYVALFTVTVSSAIGATHWTGPVDTSVLDFELDLYPASIDPTDAGASSATSLATAYTVAGASSTPNAVPALAAGTYYVVATQWPYTSGVSPAAWDPAADWGSFTLDAGGGAATPWTSMTNIPLAAPHIDLAGSGRLDDSGSGAVTFDFPPSVVPAALVDNPRWRRSYSYTAPSVNTATWQMVKQTKTLIVAEKWGTWQIIVDGVDVTYFRDARTRMRGLSRAQPGGPEQLTLIFPRAFPFEAPGGTSLPWLRDGAAVTIRKRNSDRSLSAAIAWEYDIHRLVPVVTGDDWHWEADCKGFVHSTEQKVHQPPTTFFTDAATDIGTRVAQILYYTGRKFSRVPKVVTGILTGLRGSLSQSKMSAVLDLLSVAWTSDGRQWSLIADPGPGRKMRIGLPSTSVSYHIALGAHGLDLSGVTPGGGLADEGDEAPNVIYGEYVTPDGYRSQNLKYPHAHEDTAPPYPGPPTYSPGDATTGFAPFADWLREHGYSIYSHDTYDARDEDDVRAAQKFLGITVDGIVGAQTWGTAFNTGANVGDLGAAFYAPLAADPRTQPRSITPDGQDLGPNPLYDPTFPVREIYLNFGSGVTRRQVLRAARKIIARNTAGYNYAGQITMACDPEECSRLEMLEGKILAVRYFAGSGSTGVPFFIGRVSIEDPDSDECQVVLDVDTKLRDAPTLTQLIENRRDAKNDPARQRRLQETGKLSQTNQPVFDRDNAAGKIYKHTVQGGFWRVVRFPAGSYGTFVELLVTTSPAAEIVGGLFVKPVTANFMEAKVGNPLDPSNNRPFDPNRADLKAAGFIQGWGSGVQPGGYSDAFTGAKTAGDPLTGKIEDNATTDWAAFNPPWLYWVEYCASTVDVTVTFLNAPEQV